MVNSRNMRYNPYWYQGLDYVEEDPKLANIDDDIDMQGHAIVNLKDPVNAQDAASKKYVDDAIAAGGGGPGGGPLQASQIHSQAVGHIQSTNVQDALQEINDEVAFLGEDNVFGADNVFDKSPQLSANAVPSNDSKALASIGQVTAMVAARAISAGEVSVDQTTPLTNLSGTNVQDVIKQADSEISKLKEKMTLVGTYDVANDMVLSVIGAAASGGIVKDNGLPSASLNNANMYLIVKTRGKGSGFVPDIQFEPGDIVYSKGTAWDRLVTSITTTPITASTVPSTQETNITATNVQAVIKEISDRAAFKDIDNTFSKPIKLDASVTPTDPQDLATVKKVEDVVSALTLDASKVNVNQTPALVNLHGTNVQAVIKEIDDLFGTISDNSVDRTSFVGLYDAKQNIVTKTFASANAGNIVEGNALPAAGDVNKNMFLYVIIAGKWTGTSPAASVSVGDFLMSDGAQWFSIPTGGLLTASDISVTTISGVAGNNVQEVLDNLVKKPILTQASNISVTNEATLGGANVQAVLESASTKIEANATANTALSNKVDNLDATQVAFDNSAGSIPAAPGTTVDTVQKAVEGLVTKINNPAPINATNVTFTSASGLVGTNVAAALDELKASADSVVTTYVRMDGGTLRSDLDAGGNKITQLGDPADGRDAANKNYVDTKGNDYVTKTGGQLTGDLNAGGQKITNLANPVDDTDAVNKRFFASQSDANYVKRSGGQLDTDLNANNNKIINLADPTENHHAANRMYVTNEFAKCVTKSNGTLDTDLNAANHKITNLANGDAASDAVNKGQLDDAIDTLQSQLTGKLTFVGTYNANTNKIASVNQAITNQFPEYQVNNDLPADNSKFANHFLIVTVKGQGVAPAPVEALNVGDLIYSPGGAGWGMIPLGKTTAASNVSVDPITQLPGVSDVQTALQQIASRPAGAATAATTTFNPVGNIVATNVQDALAELDTEKAADSEVVKLSGDQTVNGVKTFSSQLQTTQSGGGIVFKVSKNDATYLEWKETDNTSSRFCFVGFESTGGKAFKFVNSKTDGSFEFNKVCRYSSTQTFSDPKDIVSKSYVDGGFVSLQKDERIDGNKVFLKKIALQLNSVDSKFDFLTGDYTPQQAPVRMSLIQHSDSTHGAITRVFGFQYIQPYETPVAENNFVLRMSSGNGDYIWFRLAHKPNFNNVKCYVSGNKLSFYSINASNAGVPTTTNTGVILEGIKDPTGDTHAVNRKYADSRYVRTGGGDQIIQGTKTFGSYIRAGYGAGFLRFTPEDNSTKTLYFSDTSGNQTNRRFNIDLDRKSQLKNLVDPTNDYDAAHKKYVDDKTSNGLSVERVQDVDVTAAVASLANKGSLTFSYRLTRDPVTKDVLSALFGMKLTLTSVWNPGSSTTPVELSGCHIAGEEYFKGLPIPVDSTLQGGSFKTVAQIQLIRVVPDGGINLPQSGAPFNIGRIVCKIDSDNTKLYAVFNYANDITVPSGTGAFFIARYEGLPSMTI